MTSSPADRRRPRSLRRTTRPSPGSGSLPALLVITSSRQHSAAAPEQSTSPTRGETQPMAQISAQMVRDLRDRTGAGMMDCKRALEETDGDVEKATALLRERGLAAAAKRA